jgi:hypothetical protein
VPLPKHRLGVALTIVSVGSNNEILGRVVEAQGTAMPGEPNGVEQAVSRTLRDNLEKIQRTADELHQAVNDMVAACASSRASNALPSMLRAQTSAASLSATLEVLSRFVTGALQSAPRSPFEAEAMRVPTMGMPSIEAPVSAAPPSSPAFEPPAPSPAPPRIETRAVQPPPLPQPPAVPAPVTPPAPRSVAPPAVPPPPPVAAAPPPPAPPEPAPILEPIVVDDPVPLTLQDVAPEFDLDLPIEAPPPAAKVPVAAAPVFNLDSLPPEEQELHRRAYRVAKVCMQDIRMLRPEDVRLGRQNKDLCSRLRDDLEKAHKEYDRRFNAIQSHPVDYFYDWLVEILAGGDPQALGEYPYPSPVLRR